MHLNQRRRRQQQNNTLQVLLLTFNNLMRGAWSENVAIDFLSSNNISSQWINQLVRMIIDTRQLTLSHDTSTNWQQELLFWRLLDWYYRYFHDRYVCFGRISLNWEGPPQIQEGIIMDRNVDDHQNDIPFLFHRRSIDAFLFHRRSNNNPWVLPVSQQDNPNEPPNDVTRIIGWSDNFLGARSHRPHERFTGFESLVSNPQEAMFSDSDSDDLPELEDDY